MKITIFQNLVVIWFRNAMGWTICHTVHTYFFPKHQYIMNLSPTDQLFFLT